jgi:hypothetical protein
LRTRASVPSSESPNQLIASSTITASSIGGFVADHQ